MIITLGSIAIILRPGEQCYFVSSECRHRDSSAFLSNRLFKNDKVHGTIKTQEVDGICLNIFINEQIISWKERDRRLELMPRM